MRILPAVVMSALLAGAASVAPAGASVARYDEGPVVYLAGPGEANRLEVRSAGDGKVGLEDPGATIDPGNGCSSVGEHAVVCDGPFAAAPVLVDLRDRDDSATALDDMTVVVKGGDGRDVLTAGGGYDELAGGRGVDTLIGGSGWDELVGGPGADVMEGGPGRDSVSYRGYTRPVQVDLRTQPSSGGADGEGDSIDEVEGVLGGEAGDMLGGRWVTGWGGDDVLRGTAGRDGLHGMDGDDTIEAGAGPDWITGGHGRDAIFAGAGDDRVETQDGRFARDGRDVVRCGPGADSASAFDLTLPARATRDVFASTCERVVIPSYGLRSIRQTAGPPLRELRLRISRRRVGRCEVDVAVRAGDRLVGEGHATPRKGSPGIARVALDEYVRDRVAEAGSVRLRVSLSVRYDEGPDRHETTGWTLLLRGG